MLKKMFYDQIFSFELFVLTWDKWKILAGQANQSSEVKFSYWEKDYQLKSQLTSMFPAECNKWCGEWIDFVSGLNC